MKIAEVFYSVQGEVDVGKPSIFVRLSGCNLINEGRACQFCDSLYAENGVEKVATELWRDIKDKGEYCRHIIFTGGEPTTQFDSLYSFILFLKDKNYTIDIETNGTYFNPRLSVFNNINCSPKKQAINLEVLAKFQILDNVRYKFVYENSKDLWWEPIINNLNIPKDKVYIMPEGKTRDEQLEKTEEVISYCKKTGYNFTPRLHVLVWDNKKGV